jgi:hypothetical protein
MISKKDVSTNILSIWILASFLNIRLVWWKKFLQTFFQFEFLEHSFDLNSWNIRSIWILGLLLIYGYQRKKFFKLSFNLNSWNIRLIWILGSFVNIRLVWWYQRKMFLQTFFRLEFLDYWFDLNSWVFC